MRSVRDVLRLHFVSALSPTAIATSQGCGRTTVREYLGRALKAEITNWAMIEVLSDQELELKLGFKSYLQARWQDESKAMPEWADIHRELQANKSVTMALLWQEYLEANPGGYKYSQFCEYYRRWSKKLSVVMRQSHKAGEKSFVDYCDGLPLTNVMTGELTKTQLFVGCLGASSYTFAEATLTQKLPDWLSSHVRMYEFFGGVTEITVPDNLKSAVNKPCFYEPVINESYRDLSQHYKTAIIPAHVRKPKHKAKVEANVLVAQRWILACLRHRTFQTLQELNDAIKPLLEKLNLRLMRGLKKSRRELYETLDLPKLLPLPMTRYEFAEWLTVKVNIDYHVQFDDHFYAVHFTHVGERLELRATSTVVELFLKGLRIASHRRSYIKYEFTTPPEYMPESHRAMAKWPPERLIAWAQSIGPSVGLIVEKILSSVRHPEQRYRSSMAVIRLEKKYGRERADLACGRALELGAHSYQFVSGMLKNNMDKLIVKPSTENPLAVKEEANTRGAGYYAKQTRH